MLARSEGIVLRSRPFADADLIVDYITLDMGVRSSFAKSPRKIKSRFGGSLEPFTHARVSLRGREDARLPRLTQSDIIRPFQELREDIGVFVTASEFAELVLALLPEREPNPDAFKLMLWGLEGLAASKGANGNSSLQAPFIKIIFKTRLLALAGYAPSLKGCVRCGGESLEFYPREGALLCADCRKDGPRMTLSPALLRIYRHLSGWPLEKVSRIMPSEGLVSELKRFLDIHMREGVKLSVRSVRFCAPA